MYFMIENDVGIEFWADIHCVPGGQPRLRPYELLLGKDLPDDERLLQPQDLRSWAVQKSVSDVARFKILNDQRYRLVQNLELPFLVGFSHPH